MLSGLEEVLVVLKPDFEKVGFAAGGVAKGFEPGEAWLDCGSFLRFDQIKQHLAEFLPPKHRYCWAMPLPYLGELAHMGTCNGGVAAAGPGA